MNLDEQYMQYAIQLAKLAGKDVKSNPNVGAVIVKNGNIIGSGYHKAFGEAHAEVNAINSVENKTDIEGSTIYVTLEPCNIDAKTPPCTDLIIRHKIARVVIGVKDPNPKINGAGINLLESKGIEVVTGILEKECKRLISPFIASLQKKPYVVLKWAQSSDWYMGHHQKRMLISSSLSQPYVHDLRSRVDGIMIGKNTAKIDNPMLTVRGVTVKSQPTRIIIDSDLTLKSDLKIFDGSIKTMIIHNQTIPRHKFNDEELLYCDNRNLKQLFEILFERGINRLLIEGGATLLKQVIKENLWDEAHLITNTNPLYSPKEEQQLVKSPHIEGNLRTGLIFGHDMIQIIENNKQTDE